MLRRFLGLGLLLGVWVGSGLTTVGHAYTFRQNYFPPEVVYGHYLSDRMTMPGPVNLNQASLEELKTLPGMNESVGLKLIRLRPLKNMEDLYRLPAVEPRMVQRLIEKIQTQVQF